MKKLAMRALVSLFLKKLVYVVFMYKELTMSLLGFSLSYAPLQFPEPREYYPNVDTGYTQYETHSIHGTQTYSLTFDDGPHPTRTAKILDILKDHNIKAVFFMVTNRINEKTFPIFKRVLDEGHIAASHHHAHDNNNKISESEFKRKLKKSIQELAYYYKKAGHPFSKIYYRFPYAAYGENPKYHHMNIIKDVSYELFNDNCINFAFWDIDSGDWIPGLSSKQVANNIISYDKGGKYISYKVTRVNGKKKIIQKPIYNNAPTKGGVILLHDIQQRTIQATENFIQYVKANEYRLVRLDEIDEFSFKEKNCSLAL